MVQNRDIAWRNPVERREVVCGAGMCGYIMVRWGVNAGLLPHDFDVDALGHRDMLDDDFLIKYRVGVAEWLSPHDPSEIKQRYQMFHDDSGTAAAATPSPATQHDADVLIKTEEQQL